MLAPHMHWTPAKAVACYENFYFKSAKDHHKINIYLVIDKVDGREINFKFA